MWGPIHGHQLNFLLESDEEMVDTIDTHHDVTTHHNTQMVELIDILGYY